MRAFVEEGKSITSKRGIRGPHEEVLASDIPGVTEERFEELVTSGVLYKAEMSKPDAKAAAAKRATVAKVQKAEAKAPGAKKSADADTK